jgi:hypothetical protein
MAKETKRIVGGTVREVTLTEQAQHSIEVSQNAKGDFSVSIKLYFGDAEDPNIMAQARVLYDMYRELFNPVPQARLHLKQEGS